MENNKKFTLILTSNNSDKTRSWQLSSTLLQFLSLILGILVILLFSFFIDYFSLLIKTGNLKKLTIENRLLKKQMSQLNVEAKKIRNYLDRIQTYTKKLKLISNITDDKRVLELSLKDTKVFPDNNVLNKKDFLLSDNTRLFSDPLLEDKQLHLYEKLSEKLLDLNKKSALVENNALNIYENLWDKTEFLAATPNIAPVKGWQSSTFGYRRNPVTGRIALHKGLDFVAPPGTPVWASAEGIVSHVGYDLGYGKLVILDHGYGVKSYYAHNSQILTKLGAKVKRWDVISAVGNTGSSTGAHLHYEIRVKGIPVDPSNYILDNIY
ncbi:MAG: peptidoglycan DD-metalloendopeptidase family protein [Bdellovibrionaceae bacterium]|nr:peptidoglycan DD-metalloendopeptidase family protein [Pseudobdellovibrionaceae bacterium]